MYLQNYINIYFWKFLSVFTGFLSLVLVVPNISSNSELYGVYMFVISISLYLSYADIGFLAAGQKYSAEYFAQGDLENEQGIMGFVFFLMVIFFIPFIFLMLYLSLNPFAAFKELEESGAIIASQLFLIMGLLFPIQILSQRIISMVLSIRLLDYIATRFEILLNVIKMISIIFFFKDGRYLIVEYFLFCTVISILCYSLIGVLIKYQLNYSFSKLSKYFFFNKKHFHKTKNLAVTSFIATLSFILFYELDLILIGKFIGSQELAIYAIAFTFLNFLRSLWVIIYTPVASRINHFVGLNQLNKLYETLEILIKFTFPLYFLGVFILLINTENLVLYWVGEYYKGSIIILQILVVSVLFNYIIQPATQYFYACTKYKYIYLSSAIMPIIFFTSIIVFYENYGILSFAMGKLFSIIFSFALCVYALSEVINPIKISLKWMLPFLIFSFLIFYLNNLILDNFFISPQKDSFNLVIFMTYLSSIFSLSYLIAISIFKDNRIFIYQQYKRLLK